MVKDKNCTTLGLEYFCTEGERFWRKNDQELIRFALRELEEIKIARVSQFIDGFYEGDR